MRRRSTYLGFHLRGVRGAVFLALAVLYLGVLVLLLLAVMLRLIALLTKPLIRPRGHRILTGIAGALERGAYRARERFRFFYIL